MDNQENPPVPKLFPSLPQTLACGSLADGAWERKDRALF